MTPPTVAEAREGAVRQIAVGVLQTVLDHSGARLSAEDAYGCIAALIRAELGEYADAVRADERREMWTAHVGSDYDRSIHTNPSAAAWADLFVQTYPAMAEQRDLMLGWFANSMMAMHDNVVPRVRQEIRAATVHACITAVCDVRADRATARGPMYDCGDYRRRVLHALYAIAEDADALAAIRRVGEGAP